MSLTAHPGEWVQSQHSATRPLFSIHPFTINISQLFFLTSISLTNISATLESFGFPNIPNNFHPYMPGQCFWAFPSWPAIYRHTHTCTFCTTVQSSVPWKAKTVPDRSTSIPKLLFHWEGAILSVLPVFLDFFKELPPPRDSTSPFPAHPPGSALTVFHTFLRISSSNIIKSQKAEDDTIY